MLMWNWLQPASEEIFNKKYKFHRSSIEEVFNDVATVIASVEKKDIRQEIRDKFYDMMIGGRFIPAGRILANAWPGSKIKNYINCFTIGIQDDMDAIFTSLKEDAKISKVGGGVGFDVSPLRPRGTPLSVGGEASGPISFLRIFDASAKTIMTGGSRRCLPKGSWINTRLGMKKIEDVNIGDEVLTSDNYKKISDILNQGEQETIIIVTQNGNFECSLDHKVPIFDSCFTYIWKEAKDLKASDKLVFVSRAIEGSETDLPAFSYINPKHSTTCRDIAIPKLDADIAWLLGLLHGDGCVSLIGDGKGKVSIAGDAKYPEIIERAFNIFKRFGVKPIITRKRNSLDIEIHSKQLALYLSQFKTPKTDITIPDLIMQGKLEIRSAYLAGLFDSDGCARNRSIKAVTTIYPNFRDQIVALYSSLGAPVKIKYNNRNSRKYNKIISYKSKYTIKISNSLARKIFDDLVAPNSIKYQYRIRHKKNDFYGKGKFDNSFPMLFFLKENIRKKDFRVPVCRRNSNITFSTLERVLDKKLHLVPIEVYNLEKGRLIETYDLEVEDKHEFVCNGFLTHNSAHIALLDISHPDVEEFILAKQGDKNRALSQFNVSVKITDKFMKAVEEDLDWELSWGGKAYKTVKAKYLYDLMVKNAYEHNEPGIFNIDIVNRYNNGWWLYEIHECNPCGEQPIPKYNVCDLGAINLTSYAMKPFSKEAYFDFERFSQDVQLAVRFLDNVLDAAEYPLEKIKEQVKNLRRIGLGFTGLGDTFAMLGTKYGDEKSRHLSEEIAKSLRDNSYIASTKLAQEKNPFLLCDKEKLLQSKFIKKLPKAIKDGIAQYGLRNIALNTVAPTGTISFSIGLNCSSGIEPIFALEYKRRVRTKNDPDEYTESDVFDYAWGMWKVMNSKDKAPDYFVTAKDVSPKDSIDIQAIFQEYIDAAISKTLNLAPGTTFEQYKNLFRYAYEKGLKGFTTYNPEGSMKGILEYNEPTENVNNGDSEYIKRRFAPKRPLELECDIHQMIVNSKKIIVLVGKLKGSLYEIFVDDDSNGSIDIGKHKYGIIKKVSRGRYDLVARNGTDAVIVENLSKNFGGIYGSLARLVSMSLRHGTPLQFIVEQLTKSNEFVGFERSVSRVLKKYIKDGEKVMTGDRCPECDHELEYREGCVSCNCGWSKCI